MASLVGRTPAVAGVSSCGAVAVHHVIYSQTRDQTCVPCIGRQILYY